MNGKFLKLAVFFILEHREIKTADWKEKILYFLGRRRGFIVEGNSMSPTFENGTAVLVKNTKKIKKGDVVLVRHPYKKSVKILKRVAEISDDGKFNLVGDNPSESSDSRSFGLIAPEDVIGKVVCRLK